MTKPSAHCPECGKEMKYDRTMNAWDCGPESEDGHGFWNKAEVDWYPTSDEMTEAESTTFMDENSGAR